MKIKKILLSLFIVLGSFPFACKAGESDPVPWKFLGITWRTVSKWKEKTDDGRRNRSKFEPHWTNIFKASAVAVTIGVPVSIYAYAKNYAWVNNQFWNLFKR